MVLLFAMLCLACMCEGQARLSTAALRMQWFHVAQPPRFKTQEDAFRGKEEIVLTALQRKPEAGRQWESF